MHRLSIEFYFCSLADMILKLCPGTAIFLSLNLYIFELNLNRLSRAEWDVCGRSVTMGKRTQRFHEVSFVKNSSVACPFVRIIFNAFYSPNQTGRCFCECDWHCPWMGPPNMGATPKMIESDGTAWRIRTWRSRNFAYKANGFSLNSQYALDKHNERILGPHTMPIVSLAITLRRLRARKKKYLSRRRREKTLFVNSQISGRNFMWVEFLEKFETKIWKCRD